MGRELTPNRIAPFTSKGCPSVVLCGISTCFQVLSPCLGQIAHALLTRPPLEYSLPFRRTSNYVPARLACVKHAASVRPEPGSNSYVQSLSSFAALRFQLAKASSFSSANQAFTLSESDCSFFLIYSLTVSFSRIVAVVRTAVLATTLIIITTSPLPVNPFLQVFLPLTQ